MLTGLAAECTATYSLSKYNFHQDHIEEASGGTVSEYNEDLIRSAICTIVFCVFVATLFGADFFFLVFWPRRRYPSWYHHAKKAAAVIITLGVLGSAIASTVSNPPWNRGGKGQLTIRSGHYCDEFGLPHRR